MGGLPDHGLEIVVCALKLRQSHLLPLGTPPGIQTRQAEAWTAGIAYAALLHDIGKLVTDLHVHDKHGQRWQPWHGPLRQPYRYCHNPDRQHRLHSAAAGLLAQAVLGREALDWLSGFPELWSAVLHALAGQYEHAGIPGELVIRADQASVARALGGDPNLALNAPHHALQRKLLDGLRYLLHDVFKLNQPEASWVRRPLAYRRTFQGGVDTLSESAALQDASASPHDGGHSLHRSRADRHGFCDSHKRRRSPARNA